VTKLLKKNIMAPFTSVVSRDPYRRHPLRHRGGAAFSIAVGLAKLATIIHKIVAAARMARIGIASARVLKAASAVGRVAKSAKNIKVVGKTTKILSRMAKSKTGKRVKEAIGDAIKDAIRDEAKKRIRGAFREKKGPKKHPANAQEKKEKEKKKKKITRRHMQRRAKSSRQARSRVKWGRTRRPARNTWNGRNRRVISAQQFGTGV
jgi:hypothetical protein